MAVTEGTVYLLAQGGERASNAFEPLPDLTARGEQGSALGVVRRCLIEHFRATIAFGAPFAKPVFSEQEDRLAAQIGSIAIIPPAIPMC